MRLLMVSGDRQVSIGEKGPFFTMQREFSRHFERIDVLCPKPEKPPTVSAIHERVHLHPADVARSEMVRWIVAKGTALIEEHGASLIVSHDYGRFYNGRASAQLSRTLNVPFVSEIHHVPGHPVAADMRERFEKQVTRAYVRWARSRAAAFRVVNHVEMPTLLARWGVPAAQILVLPSLYIDLDVFHVQGEPIAFEYDVCFVGRMVDNKGLARIVDALASLERRGMPLKALFVGKGPLLADTKARVLRRGLASRVRFVEWVESPVELADIYRRSRVVVCASTCEGGPRFTVEAMACGTPVVSTKVGVMLELIRNGENGELVDFDVESLANGLQSVLSDETRRRALGVRAALDVQAYEYTRTIRGYADGLKALVARQATRS